MPSTLVRNSKSLALALYNTLLLHGKKPLLGRRRGGLRPELGPRVAVGEYDFLTYEAALTTSARLATAVQALGLPLGCAVGLCLPNIPEWVLIDFALVFQGAMSVGIHAAWGLDKIAFVVQDACVRCLFTDAATAQALVALSGTLPSLTHIVVVAVGDEEVMVPEVPVAEAAGLQVLTLEALLHASPHVPSSRGGSFLGEWPSLCAHVALALCARGHVLV